MPKKIDAAYNMTAHDVHNEAKFEDKGIGIFPEFVDGYGVLVSPTDRKVLPIAL